MRNVVITESDLAAVREACCMTKFKFMQHVCEFLADLKVDPVHADVGPFFKSNGIDRGTLVSQLKDYGALRCSHGFDDRDAEGNPKPAQMTVRYTIPAARFRERISALYDDEYAGEGAVPEYDSRVQEVNEDGGGATSCCMGGGSTSMFGAGGFVTPMAKKPVKRNIVSEGESKDDTSKSSAVYVFCRDASGAMNILCARRAGNEDEESGKYNPTMGHRHKGETYEECAVRECFEESGVRIQASDLVDKGGESWGRNFMAVLGGVTDDHRPGRGDGENEAFSWMPVRNIGGKEWAWSCGEFAMKFAEEAERRKK